MKYAIFILVHHNPWLINASLITLLAQTNQEYDLHFIYIKGDGDLRKNNNYKEFYEIADSQSEVNVQLTPDDERILNFINKLKLNFTLHQYENDHGLDSGAWYKLIQSKVWEKYDYSFFLMEGFLFSSKHSLDSMLNMASSKKINFMSMGFEKRFINYSSFNKMHGDRLKTQLELYHEKQANYIADIFSRDIGFKDILSKWPNNLTTKELNTFSGRTEYHVNNKKFSYYNFFKYFFKRIIRHKKIINLFKKKLFINNDGDLNLYNLHEITNIFDSKNNIYYHKEVSSYFFSCMCQHMLSNELLSSFSDLLENNKLYKDIDVPYSATGLEAMWGIMPHALNYEKWFTDGIHRPRKNYITLLREDNVYRMCYYINKYYKDILKTTPCNDFIDIKIKNKKYQFIKNKLNT